MSARLYVPAGRLAGRSFEVGAEGITLGRSPDNDIVVDHALVSSHHARISPREGGDGFLLEDLGSRNGTFLSGLRVREPEALGTLDVVDLAGAIELIFQVRQGGVTEPAGSPSASSSPSPLAVSPPQKDDRGTAHGLAEIELPSALIGAPSVGLHTQHGAEIEEWALPGSAPQAVEPTRHGAAEAEWELPPIAPPAKPAVARPPWILVLEPTDGPRQEIALWPGERVLGRSVTCDVSIDDSSLSRRHARLVVGPIGVQLSDLGSTNHTYVEGHPIDREVELQAGVKLRFGAIPAQLLRPAEEER